MIQTPLRRGRKLVRRWADRWRRGAFVLMYHRVDEPGDDPFDIRVTPARFAEQLEMLRSRWRVVALRDLVRSLRNGEDVEGCVALTFDDGYEDNLRIALPALESADLPATVFVVSHALGREFWWDRLTRLWRARRGATGTPEFRSLHRELRGMSPGDRNGSLDALEAEAAREDAGAEEDARALTADEVRTLASGGLVEIGSHTRTHPYLPGLDEAAQRAEIEGARLDLEAIVGRPVPSMSYPYGGFDRVSAAIAESTTDYACSAAPGVCTTGARLWVGNWDGAALDAHLRARSPGSVPPPEMSKRARERA